MNIDDLSRLTLNDLQAGYASRQLSPVDVWSEMLKQVEATDDKIHALYDLRPDEAMKAAKESEARYANGGPISDFDGVPVTLKDSVNAVGMQWFHGSAMHGKGMTGKKDAPPAARLKKAGAIVFAKCVMPDYGLSASGVSSSHGIVRNPWGLKWNPGGSSAGAGASLASGIGMMSVGSDIAGSTRLPSSHCALATIKPTQGLIPHAPASTVRAAGPMTRYAADLEAWTELLSGPDVADRYSFGYCRKGRDRALKVGVSTDFGFGPEVAPEVAAVIENARVALQKLVGTVAEIETKAGFDLFLPINDTLKLRGWYEYCGASEEMRCKAPKVLFDWFKDAEDWTPEKFREIDAGIERGVNFCVDLLADVDVLLTPVSPVVNFPAEDLGIDATMPLRHTTFTAPFNQSGDPAATICGGFAKNGLPIGIQLVAKRHDDAALLRLATELEAELNVFGAGKRHWPTNPIA